MHQSTQLPRISGNLYNCALNCALPTILEGIASIAQKQENELGQFPGIAGYQLLKQKFEQWYCIPEMNWTDFNGFLQQFQFIEQELILAPVMRRFLVETTGNQHYGNIIENPFQGFEEATLAIYQAAGVDIPYQTPGRYTALEPSNANRYFYEYFGLRMRLIEYNTEDGTYSKVTNFSADEKATVIDVYFKEGHFELQSFEKRPDWKYQNGVFPGEHDRFAEIQEKITIDTNPDQTNRELAKLFTLIGGLILDKTTVLAEKKDTLISPFEYHENVTRYSLHDLSRVEGKLTYAIILLVIMQNFTNTKDFASTQLEKTYCFNNPDEINRLLDDILIRIQPNNINQTDPTNDDKVVSEEVVVVSEHNVEHLKEKVDVQKRLVGIIQDYETSYWLLDLIIRYCSFGLYRHKSGTMTALQALVQSNQEITMVSVGKALHEVTNDKQQASRLSFWRDLNKNLGNSGTDEVLRNLKDTLTTCSV